MVMLKELVLIRLGIGEFCNYLFKVHRKMQNLDSARNQFKLVEEIAAREAELAEIVEQLCD